MERKKPNVGSNRAGHAKGTLLNSWIRTFLTLKFWNQNTQSVLTIMKRANEADQTLFYPINPVFSLPFLPPSPSYYYYNHYHYYHYLYYYHHHHHHITITIIIILILLLQSWSLSLPLSSSSSSPYYYYNHFIILIIITIITIIL